MDLIFTDTNALVAMLCFPPRRGCLPLAHEVAAAEMAGVKPQGVVQYSQRTIATALGVDAVMFVTRLRELGLIEDIEKPRRGRRRRLGQGLVYSRCTKPVSIIQQ